MKHKILIGALTSIVMSGCEAPSAAQLSPSDSASDAKVCDFTFLDTEGLAAKCAERKVLGTGFNFTEGPAVDHFGNVYFTDQPNNKIHFWDWKTGAITTFLDETGRANGMIFDRYNRILTASDMYGEIWSIDPITGEHEVILDNYQGQLLNGPNDIWEHPDGSLYITDPLVYRNWWEVDDPRRSGSQVGGGYIYRLSPDRTTLTRVGGMEQNQSDLSGNQRIQPNGVVGSLDGKTLYVGYIFPRETWAYDINPDGSLSNPRKFADSHSDGMTIDARGNIYVTTRERGVTAFSPSGEKIFEVPSGRFWTGNVAFAGPNRKTLFITAADQVLSLDMHVRGLR